MLAREDCRHLAAGEEDRERAIAGQGRRALAERIVARDQPAKERYGRGLKQPDRRHRPKETPRRSPRHRSSSEPHSEHWRVIKTLKKREEQKPDPDIAGASIERERDKERLNDCRFMSERRRLCCGQSLLRASKPRGPRGRCPRARRLSRRHWERFRAPPNRPLMSPFVP